MDQGRCKITFGKVIVCAMLFSAVSGLAWAQDLTLRMPETLITEGFDKHLLTRFRFKHRLGVEARAEGEADMALGPDVTGQRVFQDMDGAVFNLAILSEERETREHSALLLQWMKSAPGRAAIEGFAPGGAAMFTTEVSVERVVIEEEFEGDALDGSRLALQHCGRCHVVDSRNRMGGIGSTPSFAAMRGRSNWPDLFRAFYTQNPHPSFTQVNGVTAPFDPLKAVHVAPVEITLEEVEAIVAFVATLEPKNLGSPVSAN